METLGVLIAVGAVGAAFLHAVWPIMRPGAALGVLPDREEAGPRSARETARLLADRDQAYRNIVDIDFDREMGKLSEEDYAQMMAPARVRAVEVLRRLDARGVREGAAPPRASGAAAASRLGEKKPPSSQDAAQETLDARLEAEILRYRKTADAPPGAADAKSKSKSKSRFCASCGGSVDEADNFCAACGHKLG